MSWTVRALLPLLFAGALSACVADADPGPDPASPSTSTLAPTPALRAGPPCQECLDRLDDCTDEATTQAEEAACFADFRWCRVHVC